MELSKKVKTALDETRMLILGAQVLLGFGFRAVFQDGFAQLPVHARYLHGAALLLMLGTTALLIAPALWHRIIAGGEDSGELHRLISYLAGTALLPFSISLGLALFTAMEQIAGTATGVLVGAGFGALALFFWYGLEFMRSAYLGQEQRQMSTRQRDETQPTPLHSKIEQMLTEARVILPGVQALLGFQLTIVLAQSFDKLPALSQTVHAIAIGLMALSIILLITPAAYHRIVYAGEDAQEFHRFGSIVVTAATGPLALGMSADVFVVIAKIADSALTGGLAAAGAGAGFAGLWYLYPSLRRAMRRGVAATPARD